MGYNSKGYVASVHLSEGTRNAFLVLHTTVQGPWNMSERHETQTYVYMLQLTPVISTDHMVIEILRTAKVCGLESLKQVFGFY